MHIEFRGKSKIPYVYKTIRLNGKVKNVYIGRLQTVLVTGQSQSLVEQSVGLTKYGQKSDISISIHDFSDSAKRSKVHDDKHAAETGELSRETRRRNEAIIIARNMAKAGVSYSRIAHELTKTMHKKIGKGTAYKWANSAKLKT